MTRGICTNDVLIIFLRIQQEWKSTPLTIQGRWILCLIHRGLCGAAVMGRTIIDRIEQDMKTS